MINADTFVIDREDIKNYRFFTTDVIDKIEDRQSRYKDLYKALILGNTRKGKVKIFFKTTEGNRYVETTVWGLTEGFVLLKRDTFIPVASIYEVSFF
ncbi:MAG: hypothetical protein EA412_03025 [Chitinophagaceae bacterium]|nr:MAG: hypothetical protein EA412_03025 [Chitinophagaceae bacterium]